MKKRTALKDCFWRVEIWEGGDAFCWAAALRSHTGTYQNIQLQKGFSKSQKAAKKNWESFAKLKGWKKWEFV